MQSLEKKIPWTLVERLPGCMLLLDYLTAVLAAHVALSGTAEIARRFRESPRLYQFLVQTIVSAPAIQPGLPPPPSVAPAGYVCSARPVIDAALGHVSRQARNVLGVGATRSDRSIGPPNLALAILDASMDVWQPLLLCVGPDVLEFLLVQTTLFTYHAGAYVQISGPLLGGAYYGPLPLRKTSSLRLLPAQRRRINGRAAKSARNGREQKVAKVARTVDRPDKMPMGLALYSRPRNLPKSGTTTALPPHLQWGRLGKRVVRKCRYSLPPGHAFFQPYDTVESLRPVFVSTMVSRRGAGRLRASFLPLWQTICRRGRVYNSKRLLFRYCQGLPAGNPLGRHLTHSAITSFLFTATEAIFPLAVWGSAANFAVIKRAIHSYATMGQWDAFRLSEFIDAMRITDMEWVGPVAPVANADDYAARRALVRDWFGWFMYDFVVPLIRSHFYATETQAYKGAIFYYPHHLWRNIERSAMASYLSMFAPLDDDGGEAGAFGYYKHRVLPKSTSTRLLINHAKLHTSARGFQDQRSYFRPVNAILKSLTADTRTTPTWSSLHKLVSEFILGVRQTTGPMPTVYGIKIDVTKAYDRLDATTAASLALGHLATMPAHVGVGMCWVPLSKGRSKHVWVTTDGIVHRSPAVPSTGSRVLVNVKHLTLSRQHVIRRLGTAVSGTVIRKSGKLFRQVVGVPQGGILSPLLCDLVFSKLEKSILEAGGSSHQVLLRWRDDFLYLTTDKASALRFMTVMSSTPIPGFHIHRPDSVTSFQTPERDTIVSPVIPWCGLVIDTRDLTISNDFSRYSGKEMATQFALDFKSPGSNLIDRIHRFCQSKASPLVLDPHLYPTPTVLFNIYQLAYFGAIRTFSWTIHYGVRSGTGSRRIRPTTLLAAIATTVRQFPRLMATELGAMSGEGRGQWFRDHAAAISWLAAEAFGVVLARRREHAMVCRGLKVVAARYRSGLAEEVVGIPYDPRHVVLRRIVVRPH